ncbi:hypothetical protein [Nocardia brasiliensis]|uniref:Uncharacterized protein n=1 Tax=Nocardia brasiliensis (strain ATCC 700358 / HUJEG-1) TaxID=1133849 RepID=K0F2W2_NOCB7|nr:hypothetical protein [Nocardia brasiliensis]AFU03490.1 hypothetical protein O3I_027705 [Nocardia brasiliensis ATCC 700358]OCF89743.1 hypothetical protein AW168_15505 [Nocardia brasiliensis]
MSDESTSTWRELLDSANAGELSLDEGVATGLAQDCDRNIENLRDILRQTLDVQFVTGFGGFPSGKVLEDKFTAKGSTGTDSIRNRIEEHIDEIMLMKEVFAKAMANYRSVDQSRADQLTGIDAPA